MDDLLPRGVRSGRLPDPDVVVVGRAAAPGAEEELVVQIPDHAGLEGVVRPRDGRPGDGAPTLLAAPPAGQSRTAGLFDLAAHGEEQILAVGNGRGDTGVGEHRAVQEPAEPQPRGCRDLKSPAVVGQLVDLHVVFALVFGVDPLAVRCPGDDLAASESGSGVRVGRAVLKQCAQGDEAAPYRILDHDGRPSRGIGVGVRLLMIAGDGDGFPLLEAGEVPEEEDVGPDFEIMARLPPKVAENGRGIGGDLKGERQAVSPDLVRGLIGRDGHVGRARGHGERPRAGRGRRRR